MTVSRHYYAAWIGNTLLHVKGGDYTRDEAFAPYIRGTLVIALPDEVTLAKLDPRTSPNPPQIIIQAVVRYDANVTGQPVGAPLNDTTLPGSGLNSYQFVRSRTIDHAAGEVTITFGGSETTLQDYRLMSATPLDMQSSSVLTAMVLVKNRLGLSSWTDTTLSSAPPGTTTLVRTNLCTNPSFETNANGWTAGNATIARVVGGGNTRGTACARIFPNSTTSNDSYGSPTVTLAGGKTYTVSADFTLPAAIANTLHARALKIVAFVKPSSAGVYEEITSNVKKNAAGVERLSVTFTVPAGVDDSIVRFYHGGFNQAGQANLYVDSVLVEEAPYLRSYFDGTRISYPGSTYAWTGTAHASTSTATELASVGDAATVWQPGETAWDFLAPLLTAARMRLYNDDSAGWRKADADYSLPGTVRISEGYNLTAATDQISRKADTDWADGVIVKYTWTDDAGVTQTRYDIATRGAGRKGRLVEFDTPYPGPGAAEYILNRAAGRGRILGVSSTSDYSVKPGQEIVATLPNSPISTGYISAVTFDFSTDEMTVVSRQLTDTPTNAWLLAPTGRSWASEPAGITWNTYTN